MKYLYTVLIAASVAFLVAYFATFKTSPDLGEAASFNAYNAPTNRTNVYASSTTLAVGTGKAILLPNSGRRYAVISNPGATIAYLALTYASTTAEIAALGSGKFTIPLAASGGSFTINGDNLYTGRVVASSSAAVEIRALEVY